VAEVHGVEVNGRLVVVNSTMGNAGMLVDMINREYQDLDGGKPARLVLDAATYNPKHAEVRDLLDALPGVTRIRERKTASVA
jgi:hypothetical protein